MAARSVSDNARRQPPSISATRRELVQRCCSRAEGALLSMPDSSSFESDWSTFKPEFVETLFPPMKHHHHQRQKKQRDDEHNWMKDLPESLRPESSTGQLDSERAIHKRLQIQAMLRHILPMVDSLIESKRRERNSNHPHQKIHIVDFGAGSGHLGLTLAYLRPHDTRVTLLERKAYACQQAQRRAVEAALQNVTVIRQSLHEFAVESTLSPQFDLGVSLHSCGVLTDAVLELCLRCQAAFCLCPCCYGQASRHLPQDYLPRSHALQSSMRTATTAELLPQSFSAQQKDGDFRNNDKRPTTAEPLSSKERRRRRQLQQTRPFHHICGAADCSSAVGSSFVGSPNFQLAKRCMQIVDADRLLWVQQEQQRQQQQQQQQPPYKMSMTSLEPLEITPKNNVILGMPTPLFADNDDDHPRAGCSPVSPPPPLDAWVALAASASENASAEAGERQKTGKIGFGIIA